MNKNARNEIALFSARFKRDYVAYLAVVLFFLIVACELIMAVSIPFLVRRQNMWDQQVDKQNMAAFFDSTRENMRDAAGDRNDRLAGEANLVVAALDELAIYLRRDIDFMSRDQINRFNAELNRIPVHRYKDEKQPYSGQLELDMGEYLKKLEAEYKQDSERK